MSFTWARDREPPHWGCTQQENPASCKLNILPFNIRWVQPQANLECIESNLQAAPGEQDFGTECHPRLLLEHLQGWQPHSPPGKPTPKLNKPFLSSYPCSCPAWISPGTGWCSVLPLPGTGAWPQLAAASLKGGAVGSKWGVSISFFCAAWWKSFRTAPETQLKPQTSGRT